jgi:hypothetical protein
MHLRAAPARVEAVSEELQFRLWVAQRLADWPTARILDFERWLLEEGHTEFLPAVRDVLWERSLGPELTAA